MRGPLSFKHSFSVNYIVFEDSPKIQKRDPYRLCMISDNTSNLQRGTLIVYATFLTIVHTFKRGHHGNFYMKKVSVQIIFQVLVFLTMDRFRGVKTEELLHAGNDLNYSCSSVQIVVGQTVVDL
jgi:hypothetical protein